MKSKLVPICKSLFWITLGSAIFALGFDMFLVPNQIGAGGISGLAMVINAFIPAISVGAFSVIVNIPLFIAGYRFVGGNSFGDRWRACSFLLCLLIYLRCFL